jgi:hypothetical protein
MGGGSPLFGTARVDAVPVAVELSAFVLAFEVEEEQCDDGDGGDTADDAADDCWIKRGREALAHGSGGGGEAAYVRSSSWSFHHRRSRHRRFSWTRDCDVPSQCTARVRSE